MEELYSIVEFEDGLQMIPSSWLTENKTAARWPQFTSHARFTKAVQKRISYENSWPLYDVKRILATASKYTYINKTNIFCVWICAHFLIIWNIDKVFVLETYEKGLLKLKKAEFISDINSESDVSEDLKKSRKDRAKRTISSSDDATDNEEIQLPPFPKIPQITYNKKLKNDKVKQQLTGK